MAITFHNDNVIKIGYNPTNVYQSEDLAIIGANENVTGRLPVTPDNTNSVFVSKAGSDSNDGTMEYPVLTINKAITLCTSYKYIVILDSGTYEEQDLNLNSYVLGILAQEGYTPSIKVLYNSQVQHIDDLNNITELKDISTISGYTFYKAKQASDGRYIIILHDGGSTTRSYYYIVYNPVAGTLDKTLTFLKTLKASEGSQPDLFGFEVDNEGGFIITWSYETSSHASRTVGRRYYGYSNNYAIRINDKTIAEINPSPTLVWSTGAGGLCRMSNGNYGLFIIMNTSYGVYYYVVGASCVIDGNLSVVAGTTATVFQHNDVNYGARNVGAVAFSNNYFMVYYRRDDNNTIYYAVYNGGTAVKSLTSIGTGNSIKDAKAVGSSVVFCYSASSTSQYFKVINTSGTVTVTQNYSSRNLSGVSVCPDSANAFNVLGTDASLGYTAIVFNRFYNDGTRIYSETAHTLYSLANMSACTFFVDNTGSEGETVYIGVYNNVLKTIKFTGYLWDGIILAGQDIELNGITVNDTELGMKYLIRGTGSLTFKYCTIRTKNELNNGILKKKIAKINGSIRCINSIFKDSDMGITSTDGTGNTLQLFRCLFYYIYDDYAIDIDGASTIDVANCVFFNNYGGIKLLNNTSASVKNLILHQNAVYDIYTDQTNSITINNSVSTGQIYNCVIGANLINSNPLFINEGAYDIDETDLHIRTQRLGYPVTSPAYQLGDDGNDAGAYLMQYTISEEQREYVTLPKPFISINNHPVNSNHIVTKSGASKTKVDSYYRVYELNWNSLNITDYNNLLNIILCKKSSIEFYPDPVTQPTDFILCDLIYGDISMSNTLPAQYNLGYQNVSIKLAHEVE